MQYTALEPSSLSSIGVKAPAFDGADVSFYATSSFIYTLFFIAILLAAFYEYVLVGIYRMEASESGIKKSNEVFKRTTLGLLGVFSLFLIIFMINKGLLTGDIGLDALKAKVTAVGGGLSGGTVGIGQPGGSAVGSGGAQVTTGSAAIEEDPRIRSQLASLPNGGISVNNSVCSNPTATRCTTVGGLPATTLSMLTILRNTCGGTIVVTGGTEAGHASHGPGKTPVDLRIGDSTLDSCVRKFQAGPTLSFCKQTFINFGYTFCDEKNTAPHWHTYK